MTLPFTALDVLVVLVLGVSAGYAAWRGFLWETLTIFAWAAAAFATLYFGPWLMPLAHSMIGTAWMASVAAYAGVFLAVFIPLSFMSHRFSQTVKNSPIGPLDRGLGIAFGVVRGLVLVGLAYLAFTYFVPVRQQPGWLIQARSLPVMQSTAQLLLSLVPDQSYDGKSYGKSYGVARPPAASDDDLGALIRRQNDQASMVRQDHAQPAPAAPKKGEKGYGAGDRRALDKLMETGRP